jgi:hypothetical protein
MRGVMRSKEKERTMILLNLMILTMRQAALSKSNEFGIFQWDKNPMWDMTETELQRAIHSKTSASCFKLMQTLARAYHQTL